LPEYTEKYEEVGGKTTAKRHGKKLNNKTTCAFCGKILRHRGRLTIRGTVKANEIKRGNPDIEYHKDCPNPNCPSKGIERLLKENRSLLE